MVMTEGRHDRNVVNLGTGRSMPVILNAKEVTLHRPGRENSPRIVVSVWPGNA